MTAAELRAALSDVPDDAEVVLYSGWTCDVHVVPLLGMAGAAIKAGTKGIGRTRITDSWGHPLPPAQLRPVIVLLPDEAGGLKLRPQANPWAAAVAIAGGGS